MEREITEWARRVSIDVWSRLFFTYSRKEMRIHEVTLTQNLIYQFFLFAENTSLPVRLYEAKAEQINGNDIEILIETNLGYLAFPCQAKRIYPNGKYEKLDHSNEKGRQVDLLLRYANRNGAIPLYLFYNGLINRKDHLDAQLKTPGLQLSHYGCSLAHATEIGRRFIDMGKKPHFVDIHPELAFPFFQLFALLRKDVNIVDNEALAGVDFSNLMFYKPVEVLENDQWENLNPIPQIGRLPQGETDNFIHHAPFDSYYPRYRAVISRNPELNKVKVSYYE